LPVQISNSSKNMEFSCLSKSQTVAKIWNLVAYPNLKQ